jgi:hypothetical protein
VGICKEPGVNVGNIVVLVTMQHEERARCQLSSRLSRVESGKLRGPRFKPRRKVGAANRSEFAGPFKQPAWMLDPIVERRRGAKCCHTTDTFIGDGMAQRERTAARCANEEHRRRRRFRFEVIDSGAKVVGPTTKREVAFAVAAATEGKGHCDPAALVCSALAEFRKGQRAQASIKRASGEAMAHDDTGKPLSGTDAGQDQMARQLQTARKERAVHVCFIGGLRTDASARFTGAIAPVACLGQRVGAEAQIRLGRHQFVHDHRVVAPIEVVNDL